MYNSCVLNKGNYLYFRIHSISFQLVTNTSHNLSSTGLPFISLFRDIRRLRKFFRCHRRSRVFQSPLLWSWWVWSRLSKEWNRRMSSKIHQGFLRFQNRPDVVDGLSPLQRALVIVHGRLIPISVCLSNSASSDLSVWALFDLEIPLQDLRYEQKCSSHRRSTSEICLIDAPSSISQNRARYACRAVVDAWNVFVMALGSLAPSNYLVESRFLQTQFGLVLLR